MSTATSYKLTYFNGRGLAEVTRLLFAASGVVYDDHRFQPSAETPPELVALKPTLPYGQVPILELDGGKTVIAQSRAIENFLARRFGFFGLSDIEAAHIESVVEAVRDIVTGWIAVRSDATAAEQYLQNKFVDALKLLDRFASQHGSKGHFVGSTLSLADLHFDNLLFRLGENHTLKYVEQFPHLKAIHEAVRTNEKIAAYLKTRPVTPF